MAHARPGGRNELACSRNGKLACEATAFRDRVVEDEVREESKNPDYLGFYMEFGLHSK